MGGARSEELAVTGCSGNALVAVRRNVGDVVREREGGEEELDLHGCVLLGAWVEG